MISRYRRGSRAESKKVMPKSWRPSVAKIKKDDEEGKKEEGGEGSVSLSKRLGRASLFSQARRSRQVFCTKLATPAPTFMIDDEFEWEALEWMLLSERGDEFGPFSRSRMRLWHEEGEFNPETLVQNINQHDDYHKLGDIFPRLDRAFQHKNKSV